MRKKLIIWTLLVAMLVGMVGCNKEEEKALSGEEFIARMEQIGYTGDSNGGLVTRNDGLKASPIWFCIANKEGADEYDRPYFVGLELFKDRESAKEEYTIQVELTVQHSKELEIEKKTDTLFITWNESDKGTVYCRYYCLVDNTIMNAIIPESDVEGFEKAMEGTGYLK